MKKCLVLFLLLGAVAAFVCARPFAGASDVQAKSSAASSVDADKAAIENLWANYSKYAMEGNFDAFLALHDHDAYKMPQNQPMFQLWVVADTMRASWSKRVQMNTMRMSIEPKEIVILGDYAYSMGTYTQILTPKAGGPQTVFNGKFLDVLHKDANGNWEILRDCYNSNNPPGK